MKDLKNSGRRAFLRGAAGAALALPLLELTHGKAWSQSNVTKRFLTVFSHGGTITDQSHSSLHDGTGKYLQLNHWKPADPGENLVLGAARLFIFLGVRPVLQPADRGAADPAKGAPPGRGQGGGGDGDDAPRGGD